MIFRQCGGCTVCCEVAAVPTLNKPAFTRCSHQLDGFGCVIFGKPQRPVECVRFGCEWLLRGFGETGDRPDKIGVMFSINRTPTGPIGALYELEPDAAIERGKHLAIDFARTQDIPLIVIPHGDEQGRWVVIRDELKGRAKAIIGEMHIRLADDVAMYEGKAKAV